VGHDARGSITLKTQGSFAFGGTVVRGANGDTFHGDHGYVQYQIPRGARKYPLVMWHGGGQFSRTWETTPDGRDGYQNIFLRRRFSTYILDQPRRGRAGRTTKGTTIPDAAPSESSSWNTFRLGIWVPPEQPTFFPNVQFPKSPEAIDQYFRQITPNTGPEGRSQETWDLMSGAVADLFKTVGPGILLTHSNSGQYGWLTRVKSGNVKAIVSYEPATFVFPSDQPPPDVPTENAQVAAITAPIIVSPDKFRELTRIPIQLVYGDNMSLSVASPIFGVELWRIVWQRALQFAATVNSRGGQVSVLKLPDIGMYGNTHFPFSDLNNVQVANLLSQYLSQHNLD
jgi:hypothetical protein